jgi:hypothetical protein
MQVVRGRFAVAAMPSSMQMTQDLSGLKNVQDFLNNKKSAVVGVLQGDDSRPDGESNASIGLTQEVGSFSKGIPMRSWLRMPLRRNENDIVNSAEKAIAKNIDNPKGQTVVAATLGIAAEAAIQQAFATQGFGQWLDNAATTIKSKGGRDTPLIDSGEFRQAITSGVV